MNMLLQVLYLLCIYENHKLPVKTYKESVDTINELQRQGLIIPNTQPDTGNISGYEITFDGSHMVDRIIDKYDSETFM